MRLSAIHESLEDLARNWELTFDKTSQQYKDAEGFGIKQEGSTFHIFYNNRLIRSTTNSDLAERFFDREETLHKPRDGGWKMMLQPRTVYKATNAAGTIIPGFMTTDLGEAEIYLGGDWGGPVMTQARIKPEIKRIEKAYVLSGQEGNVVIMPGMPSHLIRGTEVIVLAPTKLEPVKQ